MRTAKTFGEQVVNTLKNKYVIFRIEVAIKEASSPMRRDEMLDEAKAMIRVSKHDHIVNIQGNCQIRLHTQVLIMK